MKRGMPDFSSVVLDTFFRYMIPFVFVFGIYVLIHGEYSPGGGFQAGALLAFAVVLTRIVQDEYCVIDMSGKTAFLFAAAGSLIFALIGIGAVFFGGNVLDYGAYPINLPPMELRPLGIVGIEVGVTLTVAGVIISIYDAFTRKDELR